jgi:hypothetical protein
MSHEGLAMSEMDDSPTNGTSPVPASVDLAPPDYCDPVIGAYKKYVDRTLLRENLKLTVEQR